MENRKPRNTNSGKNIYRKKWQFQNENEISDQG